LAAIVACAAAVAAGAAALVLIVTPSSPQSHVPGLSTSTGPPISLAPDQPTASGQASVPLTTELSVPIGKVHIRVIEGDGVTVPMFLAMHYPRTGQPGGGSNAVFYAHAQQGMFLGLYSVHIGDEVRAIRADGTQVIYRVRSVQRVPFDDVSVLAPTPYEEITLLTCTSYNPRTPRLIITGTPA
jgi:LPXTG-site transpeptidase (sortase) family protein